MTRPSASVRQFIELAVNMPEHEPQVGRPSVRPSSRPVSSTSLVAEAEMVVIRSDDGCTRIADHHRFAGFHRSAETNTWGCSAIAALSMPG